MNWTITWPLSIDNRLYTSFWDDKLVFEKNHSFLSLFLSFSQLTVTHVLYLILPMTGFKPQTSASRSNCSANCATKIPPKTSHFVPVLSHPRYIFVCYWIISASGVEAQFGKAEWIDEKNYRICTFEIFWRARCRFQDDSLVVLIVLVVTLNKTYLGFIFSPWLKFATAYFCMINNDLDTEFKSTFNRTLT